MYFSVCRCVWRGFRFVFTQDGKWHRWLLFSVILLLIPFFSLNHLDDWLVHLVFRWSCCVLCSRTSETRLTANEGLEPETMLQEYTSFLQTGTFSVRFASQNEKYYTSLECVGLKSFSSFASNAGNLNYSGDVCSTGCMGWQALCCCYILLTFLKVPTAAFIKKNNKKNLNNMY